MQNIKVISQDNPASLYWSFRSV